MRTPGFRDRFPESHVARWENDYRDYVFWGHLWTRHESLLAATQPRRNGEHQGWRALMNWTRRLRARVVFSRALRQFRAYVPDLSCYEAAGK
jgi:hypothetical protein